MTVVKELITKLKFKTDKSGQKQYERGLKHTEKVARRTVQNQVRGFMRISQSFGRTGSRIKSVWGSAMSNAMAKSSKLTSKVRKDTSMMSGFYARLRGDIMALGAGFVGFQAVKSFASQVFNTNVELIKMKAALKTATGGAAEADKAFGMIKNFAATTPFALEQSIGAFIKLKNLGLDPSEAAMRSYGNTATAMGKDMNQMIEAVADAATFQFERLKEFGIKANQQGDQVTFTFRGVKTTVKKDAKEVTKYLRGIGDTNFGTAMADQMNTLPGILSNLSDNWNSFLTAIGEGGLDDSLAKMATLFRDFVGQGEGFGKTLGKTFGGLVESFIPFVRQAMVFAKTDLPGIMDKIKSGATLLAPALKLAAGAATVLLARMVGMKALAIAGFIYQAVTAIRAMTFAQWASAAAGWAMNAAIGFIPILIGAAIAAVAFLAYDMYSFFTTGESMLLGWLEDWPLLKQAVENVYTSVMALWMGLTDMGGTIEWWKNVFSQAWDWIKQKAQETWLRIKIWARSTFEAIKARAASMVQSLIEKFLQLKEYASTAFNGLKNILSVAFSPIQTAIGWVTSLYNKFSALSNLKMPSFSFGGGGGGNKSSKGRVIPSGFPNDSFPTWAETGEIIVSAKGVKQIMSGDLHGGLSTVPGFSPPMPAAASMMAAAPQPMRYGGGGMSVSNNIKQSFHVSVQGSNATASQIARTTGREAGSSVKAALDMARRSYPRRASANA